MDDKAKYDNDPGCAGDNRAGNGFGFGICQVDVFGIDSKLSDGGDEACLFSRRYIP